MTKRELSKYYFLNLEIKDLKNQMIDSIKKKVKFLDKLKKISMN